MTFTNIYNTCLNCTRINAVKYQIYISITQTRNKKNKIFNSVSEMKVYYTVNFQNFTTLQKFGVFAQNCKQTGSTIEQDQTMQIEFHIHRYPKSLV